MGVAESLTLAASALRVHRGDPWVVADLLDRPGALAHGHFRLLSGLHSGYFLRFSKIADDADAVELIGRWLAPSIAPLAASAVFAPSKAGVALGWVLARELGIPVYLALRNDDGRARGVVGDRNLEGERVVLVTEVVTTGSGLVALRETAAAAGAAVVGACWFLSRRPVDVEALLGAPAFPVATLPLEAWSPERCPLCAAGEPAEDALDLN